MGSESTIRSCFSLGWKQAWSCFAEVRGASYLWSWKSYQTDCRQGRERGSICFSWNSIAIGSKCSHSHDWATSLNLACRAYWTWNLVCWDGRWNLSRASQWFGFRNLTRLLGPFDCRRKRHMQSISTSLGMGFGQLVIAFLMSSHVQLEPYLRSRLQ